MTILDTTMVASITTDWKILLKTEYRYACEREVIKCPTGMFEEIESAPLAVAKRELLEETGYSFDNWTYFGLTWESTSKLINRMNLFLVRDCLRVGSQYLDENEHLDVMEVSFKMVVEMVMRRTITVNSIDYLILKAARIYGL